MAIKRWNANTSTWELVGTPGTATPSAIGAATLASTGNTFLGVQTITSASEWPLISRFTNPTSTHRNHLLLQRSNNNAAVTSGFSLGGISMSGHDGANYGLGWNGGAEITAFAAETWTPSARGTHLAFFNTANGTNSIAERMRITSSGNIGIGTGNPAAKLHVGRNTTSLITGVNAVFNADTNSSLGGIQINSYDDDSKRFSIVNSNGGTSILSNGANAYLIIGTDSSQPLYFYTNNTNRMALESNGNLSLYNAKSMLFYNPINTGSGSIYCAGGGSLTMASYGQPMITLHEDSEIRFFVGTGTQRAVINNAGELLIGYTSDNGAYRLQVNSQIFATSSTIATSDGRYKENISTIESGLNIIDSLRPVSFTWKDHPKHNFVAGKTVGFIAQEVKEALSEYDWIDNIIKTNISAAVLDEEGNEVHPEEEFLGIAEGNLIPLLVAAVKELRSELNTLKASML